MRSDPYAFALSALKDAEPPRVWSMIATVFGDLALGEDEAVEGPVLSALMAQMDIRPEATRVALHRLRAKDGWITSEKVGRTSHHSLTPKGRRESRVAAQRIYGAPAHDDAWQLVLLEHANAVPHDQMKALGFASLAPRLFVGATHAEPPPEALVLSPGSAPRWLGVQFEPRELAQDYAVMHTRLERVAKLPLDANSLSPLQIATLRCFIVHGWRRLVLRHPDLPPALYSGSWRGHDCHALVADLLARLPRPSLGEL